MSFWLTEEKTQPACHDKNAYRRFPEVMTGHRYYQTETGRWLSRDLITEDGFGALYAQSDISELLPSSNMAPLGQTYDGEIYSFVVNRPIDLHDGIGLKTSGSLGGFQWPKPWQTIPQQCSESCCEGGKIGFYNCYIESKPPSFILGGPIRTLIHYFFGATGNLACFHIFCSRPGYSVASSPMLHAPHRPPWSSRRHPWPDGWRPAPVTPYGNFCIVVPSRSFLRYGDGLKKWITMQFWCMKCIVPN